MTLRKRLGWQMAIMIAGVLLTGTAAAVGIGGLHQDFGVALRANEQLRRIYLVGHHVAVARLLLNQRSPSPNSALDELDAAAGQFDVFDQSSPGAWLASTADEAAALRAALRDGATLLERAPETSGGALAPCFSRLADLSAATRRAVTARQLAADQKHRMTLAAVVVLSSCVASITAIVGVRQYRWVVRPLTDIQRAARRIASGRFSERVRVRGDEEFAALARDFNRMAEDLAGMYGELEQRVASKSRELVRSERLASVGYLAAGVAHEINNPLGIIAGYGERSLQLLGREWNDATAQYVHKAVGIICDEAFRCKQITDRLLMLARPGDQAAGRVSLARLADDVITSVGGLRRFADRRITLAADDAADLCVTANEGALRQVVLNLVINAAEAVPPEAGEVRVAVVRDGAEVELSVTDNGRGMSPATLAQVFEPFFTEKRGERSGTGLGLSIAHAIVNECRGHIDAYSAGPGTGSRFVVRLPAAEEARLVGHE